MNSSFKDILNLGITVIILFMLTLVRASHAEDCEATLQLCDAAVAALTKSNDALNAQLAEQTRYINALEKEVGQDNNILPSWAWVGIGAIVGGGIVWKVK